ncbi:TPA: restriction endonuclease subunit S, partial [Staphylococcus aureus]|nr:restriction endonuclease subunit S [Staphylococcus aureus]
FGVQAVKGVTLNNDSINSIIVKLPNEEEQNIIAKFLLEVDKTVNNQLVKTKLLKQRKKGLLQRMFV